MPSHRKPGKTFGEMLELILRNMRRPNDPFTPQLLMAIFWEESLFTNRKQERGSAIGFGQVEPAGLPSLTTQQARDRGYAVDGVSSATRSLSDELSVTVPSCMLLHLFHSSRAATTDAKVRAALNAYGGVGFTGPSSLTREDRLRIIAGWRRCEEKLLALPFSVYAIANYAGNLVELEDEYMDALALARAFQRDFVFGREPRVRFRDLLFPRGWSLFGLGSTAAATTSPGTSSTSSRPSTSSASATSSSNAPAAGVYRRGVSPPPPVESPFEDIVGQREVRLGTGEHYQLVAGPGEYLGEVVPGDLLLRQPRNGGLPRASRITSAPATPEDFFFEGVMAEPGPPGLYVEVQGGGAWPVARRLGDGSGRMAEGMLVLRPASFDSGWTESDESESDEAGLDEMLEAGPDDEFRRKRREVVAKITAADLYWHEVPLAGGYKVMVSSPVLKDDLFVPVTATETLDFARRFEVFPLSRAVMDQAHNVANQVPKQDTPSSLLDFVTYTNRLKRTAYHTQFGYALSSGAHKLWVVSSRGRVINYGFYIRRVPTDPVRCGRYLDSRQNVIQGLGARHDGAHWDYSQLLQLMTGLKDPGGQRVDLKQALLDRHPAVWDEPQPPATGSLP